MLLTDDLVNSSWAKSNCQWRVGVGNIQGPTTGRVRLRRRDVAEEILTHYSTISPHCDSVPLTHVRAAASGRRLIQPPPIITIGSSLCRLLCLLGVTAGRFLRLSIHAGLAPLGRGNWGRSSRQRVIAVSSLREGNDVTDGLKAAKQHD